MADRILSGHGSGGKLMNEMIGGLIRRVLGPESVQMDDSAVLNIGAGRIAFTTDTFTITPIEFPGGTIGSLAVNGTVNDLAVMGARPLYLSCALILEEGLETAVLERILVSMRRAADEAGVSIVTGDTKVVDRGKADKIFINTAGIGILERVVQRRPIAPGDAIVINGFIGDHGIAIMALRNKLSFSRGLASDCAPMSRLIERVLADFPESVKFMRDPTRGGVASVLNEIVKGKDFGIGLAEASLPVRDEVKGVSGMLGIDPLYAANEGKVFMVVRGKDAEGIVGLMRSLPEGRDAAVIGTVSVAYPGRAYLETRTGGRRILPLLIEEQLPRIC
ncbi:MAG TPA: hydrogenase expression/formation protein HypE [Spirochaetota bacterium]|nr:hydrogenase expression/formation protein HypE [Spirochaetota bacterium]